MNDSSRTSIWNAAPERLDRALAQSGLARSRSHAAQLIAAGQVTLNRRPATKSGQSVGAGTRLDVLIDDHYVSRGAYKLLAGLDSFALDPTDRVALDLGASTGGFTQVLLERGARRVLAIDVGRDQLAQELRADARVRLVEGCNARTLTAQTLRELTGEPERPTLVVADLSFISLGLILPAIEQTADSDADIVLLIKPQFEVGRTGVSDGIVTSPSAREGAMRTVLAAAASLGYHAAGLRRSPIVGAGGNIEYLVYFQRSAASNPAEWDEHIARLSENLMPHDDGDHTPLAKGET